MTVAAPRAKSQKKAVPNPFTAPTTKNTNPFITQGPLTMAPLYQTGAGREEYKPFTPVDISAIVTVLPLMNEGGHPWLKKMTSMTMGQDLALGDVRGMLSRCGVTSHQLQEIETLANTTHREHNEP